MPRPTRRDGSSVSSLGLRLAPSTLVKITLNYCELP